MNDKARRSYAKIAIGGVNVTDTIKPYLLSVTYTDNEEDEADDIQIKLQDRDGIWLSQWLPALVSREEQVSLSASNTIASEGVATPLRGIVNAPSGVNVRKTPSKTSEVLGVLSYGESVKIVESGKEWSVVRYDGQNGYVISSALITNDASSNPTLRFGSQGEYVKLMQSLLIDKGQSLPKFGVDGYFGSETQSAVKGFQKASNLSVDGICGPKTWAALLGSATNSVASESNGAVSIQARIFRENWTEDNLKESLDCGKFELDSIEYSEPPSVATIKGTALSYSAQIRQTRKTRAWDSYSLSGIAKKIAKENKMACMYESGYDPSYTHVEQHKQSDIAFLSHLAHSAGLSLKTTGNALVLFDQAKYEGKPVVLTVDMAKPKHERIKLNWSQGSGNYASCRVSYTTAKGKYIEGIAKVKDFDDKKDNNQQLEIYAKVSSIGEAKTLAEKYLRLHNKFERYISVTIPGNVSLTAGVTVRLENCGLWDGKYIVKQAKHTLGSGGYKTALTLRNVLNGY